ncbi:MAG: hypothetical protein NTZ56_17460 [Acidobacteria bacterium]|nr:hypothetical protein [Acidobacteriota bacterium]
MRKVNGSFLIAATVASGVLWAATIELRRPLPKHLATTEPSDRAALILPLQVDAAAFRQLQQELTADRIDVRMQPTNTNEAEKPLAVLVDASQIVRLIVPLDPAGGTIPAAVTNAARQWAAGRDAFVTHCGHCHGDDGLETTYANIKTMKAISTRLTDQKILDGAAEFGAVEVSSWSPQQRADLLLFIRGL